MWDPNGDRLRPLQGCWEKGCLSPHPQEACGDTHPDILAGGEVPGEVPGQRGDVGAPWDVDAAGELGDVAQRTLDPIEDGAQDARTQLH